MNLSWRPNACHIDMEKGEKLLITSKDDKSHFLEVSIDEYDDICFKKRQNLGGDKQ